MPWVLKRRRSFKMISQRIFRRSCLLSILTITFFCLTVNFQNLKVFNNDFVSSSPCSAKFDTKQRDYNISGLKPVIFIGGMPRSGTTLMRAILDSHPMVRCGEETRIIPRILNMRVSWKKSLIEWNRYERQDVIYRMIRSIVLFFRLLAGGMTEQILDSGVRAFVYEILNQHSQSADVLCDKDPFVLKYAAYISTIFPNSKFLLLLRDARAVIHSVMTRKVTITGFSLTDHRQNFKLWNKGIELMYEQCERVGSLRCQMVYYEQLVLQPRKTIETILNFLNLTWTDNVLHHEELVGKKISLSK